MASRRGDKYRMSPRCRQPHLLSNKLLPTSSSLTYSPRWASSANWSMTSLASRQNIQVSHKAVSQCRAHHRAPHQCHRHGTLSGMAARTAGYSSTSRAASAPSTTLAQAMHSSKAAMAAPKVVTDTARADTATRAPTTKAHTTQPTTTSSKKSRRSKAAMDGSMQQQAWPVSLAVRS